jgi:hypothetical protein
MQKQEIFGFAPTSEEEAFVRSPTGSSHDTRSPFGDRSHEQYLTYSQFENCMCNPEADHSPFRESSHSSATE